MDKDLEKKIKEIENLEIPKRKKKIDKSIKKEDDNDIDCHINNNNNHNLIIIMTII